MRVRSTASSNLPGSSPKPGAITPHQPRHEDLAEHDEDEQHREQHREGFLGEGAGRRLAALGQRRRGERHEGGAERALGEQAAEQVGQALRDKERVGDRPGAEDRRGQDVADKAEDAAHQRVTSRPSRPSGAEPCGAGVEKNRRREMPLEMAGAASGIAEEQSGANLRRLSSARGCSLRDAMTFRAGAIRRRAWPRSGSGSSGARPDGPHAGRRNRRDRGLRARRRHRPAGQRRRRPGSRRAGRHRPARHRRRRRCRGAAARQRRRDRIHHAARPPPTHAALAARLRQADRDRHDRAARRGGRGGARRPAQQVPIVWAANTSLGINLLLGLVEQVAARLGPDWDIEIMEMHHRHKVDAPSGTALALGRAAAAARGADARRGGGARPRRHHRAAASRARSASRRCAAATISASIT